MASSTSLVVVASSVVAAAVLGLAPRAQACSPLAHYETTIAPAAGESMPASAPGFLVSAEEGALIQLYDAANAPVDGLLMTDGSFRYFAPASPLSAGSYKVSYEPWAAHEGEPAPELIEAAITVTAAVPLPIKAGTLSVAASDRATRQVGSYGGSCVESADVAMVRLALAPDPALVPYGSVLAWETKVDGELWARRQGTLPSNAAVHTVLNLHTTCDAAAAGSRDDGLTAGLHDVELTPILVGSSAPIAPATLRVNVSCGADNGSVDGAGGDDDPPLGAGGQGGGTAQTGAAYTASDSGCSASPARHRPAGLASMVGLIALTMVAHRRRQRR